MAVMERELALLKEIEAEAKKLCGVILKAIGPQKQIVAMNALNMAMQVVSSASLIAGDRSIERECCGTFHRSPHRATCEKFRGKKPSNVELTGLRPQGATSDN